MPLVFNVVEEFSIKQIVLSHDDIPAIDQVVIGRVLTKNFRLDLGVKLFNLVPFVEEFIEMTGISGRQTKSGCIIVQTVDQFLVCAIDAADPQDNPLKVLDRQLVSAGKLIKRRFMLGMSRRRVNQKTGKKNQQYCANFHVVPVGRW